MNYDHFTAFRLVGASVLSDDAQASDSVLETKRLATWTQTVKNMGSSPHPFRQKAKMLLATQSQATFGQGTHTVGLDLNTLKKVRSDLMRCLWSTSFYTMNPNLTFTFLVQPHLDLLFAFTYRGLFTMYRCMINADVHSVVTQRFNQQYFRGTDGPVVRLKVLALQQPF